MTTGIHLMGCPHILKDDRIDSATPRRMPMLCGRVALLSLALVLSGGCREKEKPVDPWDARAVELRAELEKAREEVGRICDRYEMSTWGDHYREDEWWRFTLRAYRRISGEFVAIRGKEGIAMRNRWAHWLADRLEELDRQWDLKCKEPGMTGTYSSIFHSSNKRGLYEKVIRLFLLDSEGLARWNRIEGAQGTIAGEPIAFRNGETRIALPWPIFDPKPFIAKDDGHYAPHVEPNHVVTLKRKDYAVVRFPAEGNLEGCPATTEEAMLLEIVDGKITRVVGLNNFLVHGGIRIQTDPDAGVIRLEGTDGYDSPVTFVVDVASMKIIRGQSTLPKYFESDGYGQFLDKGK